jgi:hypothetical protein
MNNDQLYFYNRGFNDCLAKGFNTHPSKELTDEEILVLYEEFIETQYVSESNVLGFGRAILRKAQEK